MCRPIDTAGKPVTDHDLNASSAAAFFLPLVSREWKNGSNSSYNCTPFLHSLLTKGKSCLDMAMPKPGMQANMLL